MRTGMNKQFLKAALIYLGLFLLTTFAALYFLGKEIGHEETEKGDCLVLLNEIEQLTTGEDGSSPAGESFDILRNSLRQEEAAGAAARFICTGLWFAGLGFLFLTAGLIYVYFKILRPFYKLEAYAEEIAPTFSGRLHGLLTICARRFRRQGKTRPRQFWRTKRLLPHSPTISRRL